MLDLIYSHVLFICIFWKEIFTVEKISHKWQNNGINICNENFFVWCLVFEKIEFEDLSNTHVDIQSLFFWMKKILFHIFDLYLRVEQSSGNYFSLLSRKISQIYVHLINSIFSKKQPIFSARKMLSTRKMCKIVHETFMKFLLPYVFKRFPREITKCSWCNSCILRPHSFVTDQLAFCSCGRDFYLNHWTFVFASFARFCFWRFVDAWMIRGGCWKSMFDVILQIFICLIP